MTFSERQGLKSRRHLLQTDSIDLELRNKLWNVLTARRFQFSPGYYVRNPRNKPLWDFCAALWHSYFKSPTDSIPSMPEGVIAEIRGYFFGCEWYEVYDLLEFVANYSEFGYSRQDTSAAFNEVLASELSAYRFVGAKLAPISSEQEKQSIEEALAKTSGPYSVTTEHLQQAVTLLAQKPKPDYRNSIKESITAVEALCGVVAGKPKATLGQALKIIDAEAPLHVALRSAFEKLYGYTSDAEGIRHALLEETTLNQEDAVFMLVTCSAFISYVIAKHARQNRLKP